MGNDLTGAWLLSVSGVCSGISQQKHNSEEWEGLPSVVRASPLTAATLRMILFSIGAPLHEHILPIFSGKVLRKRSGSQACLGWRREDTRSEDGHQKGERAES